jgi:hypothetical protein
MATDFLLIDSNDPKLKEKLDGLKPTPGYCIFIDIVGSTAMKLDGMYKWVALIHNCFSDAATIFKPLKSIGDELMFYIEDADLESSGNTVLTIFDQLIQIATNSNSAYPPTKIVAAYCTSVYPMTFLPGTRDYYGIDIDCTARMKTIEPAPMNRELVIDSRMYSKIKLQDSSNQFLPQIQRLIGPVEHEAKGISQSIQVYRTGTLCIGPQ